MHAKNTNQHEGHYPTQHSACPDPPVSAGGNVDQDKLRRAEEQLNQASDAMHKAQNKFMQLLEQRSSGNLRNAYGLWRASL